MADSKWRIIFSWRMLVQFFLGISSGLPLLMIGPTLQAWMKDENINLKTIGLFSLVNLPYTLKFLWAPFMDRYVPPFLGRRRGWTLIMQIALALTVAVLAFVSPSQATTLFAFVGLIIAFFSASQDIVLDAYRREVLNREELGLGNSIFVNGYRIGMLIAGALALIVADHYSWRVVYLFLASTFLVSTIFTILAPEPVEKITPPRSMKDAVIQPFIEYFERHGAIEILLFILLYKIGDSLATNMSTPFYLSLGFTKTEIGVIAKSVGLGSTIVGGFAGGLLILRWGLRRSLIVFGILQGIAILALAVLSRIGHNTSALAVLIGLDYFASGMGTSAFVAFIASMTNKKFTATQFALLTSLVRIPGVIIGSSTGYLATALGWTNYFIFCAICAIPGLLLLKRYSHWQEGDDSPEGEPSPGRA
jgi:MFS transporter, PAT family, beta-lactamase induction signal transducer AmpG